MIIRQITNICWVSIYRYNVITYSRYEVISEVEKDKYPWLDDSDKRTCTDREILEKYINLDDSCLKRIRKDASERYDLQV